jgi:phosphoglycerate dehydrogenase-like enzyme
LLAQCDVLSLHYPFNEETRHLFGERELARLRPGAFVVNAARGGIIKKGAILEALRQGLLAGAGLDVVEDEPLRPVEEAATPNLIVAGHAAFCSGEAKIRMRSTPARNALAAVTGGHLENVVN